MSQRLASAIVTGPQYVYDNAKTEFADDTPEQGRGSLTVMNRSRQVLAQVSGAYEWVEGHVEVLTDDGERWVVIPERGCGCGRSTTITERASV